jgi:hypothetical protein
MMVLFVGAVVGAFILICLVAARRLHGWVKWRRTKQNAEDATRVKRNP